MIVRWGICHCSGEGEVNSVDLVIDELVKCTLFSTEMMLFFINAISKGAYRQHVVDTIEAALRSSSVQIESHKEDFHAGV